MSYMKKIFVSLAIIFSLSCSLLATSVAAQQATSSDDTSPTSRVLERVEKIAGEGGYVTDPATASAPRIIGLIINALLSITGIIFIILTVFAGYNWMTSEGNDEKIKKSIATLRAAILGLIITLSAWTIWNFIFDRLVLGTAG